MPIIRLLGEQHMSATKLCRHSLFAFFTLLCASPLLVLGAADNGLEQIEGRFQAFYWKPGETLSQYKRLVLLDSLVQFQDNWLRDENRGKRPNEQIKEEDMAEISQTLSDQFKEVFTEVLTDNDGYEMVNVGAADVLILRPAILNLDIGQSVYKARSGTETSPLKMTLVLEFYDSVTSTLIGRAMEIRSDQESNRSVVALILRRWAEATRETLMAGPGL